MESFNDPVKILARRFVSLPAHVRVEISGRLLRWREENQASKSVAERARFSSDGRNSFLEQFWDEVEQAHGDDLYPTNPFADNAAWLMSYPMKRHPGEQRLAYL